MYIYISPKKGHSIIKRLLFFFSFSSSVAMYSLYKTIDVQTQASCHACVFEREKGENLSIDQGKDVSFLQSLYSCSE